MRPHNGMRFLTAVLLAIACCASACGDDQKAAADAPKTVVAEGQVTVTGVLTVDIVAREENEAKDAADDKPKDDAKEFEKKTEAKKNGKDFLNANNFFITLVPAAVKATVEKRKAKQADAKMEVKAAAKKPVALGQVVAAPALNVVGNAKVNEAVIQQFVQQFRPVLSAELAFVRLICDDLSVEQRARIKAAGEAALKDAAERQAKMQMQQQAQLAAKLAPVATIRDGLGEALQATLTTEQFERYSAEAAQRAATRKRAAIDCAIARLDATLCLTADQREKLIDSIAAQWQDDWESWLNLNIYGNQYTPMIPDQLVVSHLNAEQKAVWRGLQKINFSSWNVWNGQQVEEDDNWWGDKPTQPAGQGNVNALRNFLNGFIKPK